MIAQAPTAASTDLFARKGAAGPGVGPSPALTPRGLAPAPAGGAKGPGRQEDAAKPDGKSQGASETTAPGSLHMIELRRAGALAAALARSPGPESAEAGAEGLSAGLSHRGASVAGATPPQETAGSNGPLLALLAIACFGVGLWYALYSKETAPRDDAAISQPEVPAPPEQQKGVDGDSQPVSAAPDSASEQPAALAPTQQADTAEPPEASADTGQQPSFDLIRIEPNGEAVIAGRAAPDSQLILLDNGQPIGKVTADWAGEWAFIPTTPLAPGDHEFSLVIVTPQGTVAVPGVGKPDKGSFLESPDLDSSSIIKAKAVGGLGLEQPASDVPTHKDRAVGSTPSYVVQLSSTTSLAGAEQEWRKLKRSFPQLLGDKELVVHEAALDRRGTWYRVRTGSFTDKASARKLCSQLRAKRQDCLVILR